MFAHITRPPSFRELTVAALVLGLGLGPAACTDAPDPESATSEEAASGVEARDEPRDTTRPAGLAADTAALAVAVNGQIEAEGSGPASDVPRRYAVVDLDGDGSADGLALLQGMFCGTGGCSLYVFRGTGDGFDFVSSTSLVRGPLIVSDTEANGWRDLVTEVSGGGMAAKVVRLSFDGAGYPANASDLPDMRESGPFSGQVAFPVALGAGGLDEFAALVGSYPRDVDLWNQPFLDTRLEVLVRGRKDEFVNRMQTQGPVQEEDGVYFVTGNLDDMGGSDAAMLVADPANDMLKVWILTDGEIAVYEEAPFAIHTPNDVQTMLSNWGIE